MWFVDVITWKSCIQDETQDIFNSTYSFIDNKCSSKEFKAECIENGGRCSTDIDGYYTEVVINVIYGIIWYQWAKQLLNYLQELPICDWHVLSKGTEIDDNPEELKGLKDKMPDH